MSRNKDKKKNKNVMTRQIKARYIVVPLLILLAVGGGFIGKTIYESNKYVKVATVSSAAKEGEMYAMGEEGSTYYGKLVKGSVVSVKVNNELKIDKVNVKKGDTVKKGDLLISYDTHDLEDSVADADLMVKTLTNDITIAQNELNVLTRLQPSENAPEDFVPEEPSEEPDTDSDGKETPDEPDSPFDKLITAKSKPLIGSGKEDDPFIFQVGLETVISKDYLLTLADEKEPKHAAFYVCDTEGNQLFARIIDGSKIDKSKVSDFPVSDGVTMTPDGMIAFNGDSAGFAAFAAASGGAAQEGELPEGFEFPEGEIELPEEPVQQQTTDDDSSGEITLNDNYVFSAQELRDMIAAKEKEKAALELQKKQAELTSKRSKKLAETGGEVAEIDGVVTYLAKDIYHLNESGAYLTITNDAGMSVSASVGEFSRDSVYVGMLATITNFETGAMSDGKVVALEDTPTELDGMEDMTSGILESQYKFTVAIDQDMEITEDSEVQIKLIPEEGEETFYIPTPLVRSEAARYYVMIAGENDLIEKRYVTIGSTYYGAYEITGGLSQDEYIAFPYGKAVEGAQTTQTSFEDMYYDLGIFY